MKKLLLISILAFASMFVCIAQTQYKLEKGNVSTELQFSLLNIGSWEENAGHFTMPGLRLRYAITDKWAIRSTLGLDFGHNSDKRNPYENQSETNYTGSIISKSNYTDFSILPGIEYHFGKWERISIYVGAELLFGIKTTKSTYKSQINSDYSVSYPYTIAGILETTVDIKTKNCNYYSTLYPYSYPSLLVPDIYSYNSNGNMSFGINAFTGVDFYIYKGLYLGAELGLGYTYKTALKGYAEGYSKSEVTYFDGSIQTFYDNKIDIKYNDKISSGNFAFKCNPMLRLGWKF